MKTPNTEQRKRLRRELKLSKKRRDKLRGLLSVGIPVILTLLRALH